MDVWLVWLLLAAALGVAELFTLSAALGLLGGAAAVTAGGGRARASRCRCSCWCSPPARRPGSGWSGRSCCGTCTPRPPSGSASTRSSGGRRTSCARSASQGGTVRIDGEEWSARPCDPDPPPSSLRARPSPSWPSAAPPRSCIPRSKVQMEPLLIVALVVVLFAVAVLMKAVRIVPQARARNVERLGRYHRTLTPGLNVVVPFVDRVYPAIDLREQVVSFAPRPVITEDNLVVEIDTVLYFQVTDPRSAAYEIASYLQAVEQLTVTTLRNVVGSMDLEQTLTSRDEINSRLRGVLDEATGKWGLRVNRVEIKAIDPPKSIKDAMEKQMRAERDKRASILTAEGARQSQILTAEGDKQGAILRAEGERAAAILRAEGQARAIDQVFTAVHRNDLDPRCWPTSTCRRCRSSPGRGNTFWVIPERGHLGAVGHRAGVRHRRRGAGDRGRWEPPATQRDRPPVDRPDLATPVSRRPISRRPGSTSPGWSGPELTEAGGRLRPGSRQVPGTAVHHRAGHPLVVIAVGVALAPADPRGTPSDPAAGPGPPSACRAAPRRDVIRHPGPPWRCRTVRQLTRRSAVTSARQPCP